MQEMTAATDVQTVNLLTALHAGGQYGYFWVVNANGEKVTTWFPVGKIPPIPQGQAVYWGVHPTATIPTRINTKTGKPIPQKFSRAMLQDVDAVNCLFAEFDAKDYGGDLAAVLEHVDSFYGRGYPPHAIICSGGGYHVYWLLREPFLIHNDTDRERIGKIQAGWVDLVGGDTGAKDLARVLRVPGTLNNKYNPARPVKLEMFDSDFDRYELAELAGYLPQEQPTAPQMPPEPPLPGGDLAAVILRRALGRSNRRNEDCYWLAQQLYWNQFPRVEIEHAVLSFQHQVEHSKPGEDPFTEREALRTMESAFNSKPGQPWESKNNGHHATQRHAQPPETEAPGTMTTDQPPAPEQGSLEDIFLSLPADHDGHARCLMALFPERFMFVEAYGWLSYNGKYWQREAAESELGKAIVKTLRGRRVAAAAIEKTELMKACNSSNGNVTGTRERLKDIVTGLVDTFDNDPDRLNCNNGVLDLRTGHLTPHSPKQRFTYCLPVDYDPDADRGPWLAFLRDALGSELMVGYVQAAVGYSLTGRTWEEILFYLYGPPRSGKGTFTETMIAMLGNPLAVEADFQSFTADRGGDTQNFDLAPLKPCRFVAASESNKNQPLNPAKIKSLTGRNYVRCAFKHRDHFTYQPSFKIWLSSNHPVNVDVDDDAAWGRVRVISFPTSHLGIEDKALKKRLTSPEVLRGVLAWAVEGAGLWYILVDDGGGGLAVPDPVRRVTQEQRDLQDNVKAFLDECCEPDPEGFIPFGEFYQAYKTWCELNGVTAKHLNQFTQSVGKKGVKGGVQKKINGRNIRTFTGVRLISER
jgi:putative DNA primase/helicase